MLIQIISVGRRTPKWVDMAWEEYAKRFGSDLKIELKEVKAELRTSKSVEQIWQLEAARIEEVMAKSSKLVVLDERGKNMTTLQLATMLGAWQGDAQNISLVIGGPDGLSPELKQKAALNIRLSDLTLPHFMVRVLLIEQLYRAHTINIGHPYHRE